MVGDALADSRLTRLRKDGLRERVIGRNRRRFRVFLTGESGRRSGYAVILRDAYPCHGIVVAFPPHGDRRDGFGPALRQPYQ